MALEAILGMKKQKNPWGDVRGLEDQDEIAEYTKNFDQCTDIMMPPFSNVSTKLALNVKTLLSLLEMMIIFSS